MGTRGRSCGQSGFRACPIIKLLSIIAVVNGRLYALEMQRQNVWRQGFVRGKTKLFFIDTTLKNPNVLLMYVLQAFFGRSLSYCAVWVSHNNHLSKKYCLNIVSYLNINISTKRKYTHHVHWVLLSLSSGIFKCVYQHW